MACGDNAVDVDGAHSGSRLKLRWFERDDGLIQWEPWSDPRLAARSEVFYDQELDLRCTAEAWADGVTRCTPIFKSDPNVFSDAACTLGIVRDPDTFKFVAALTTTCLETQITDVYRIVGKQTPQTVYRKEPDVGCASFGWDEGEIGVVGDAMSPAQLATITTTTSHDDERIQIRYHESEDGMRLPIGLQDELLGPASLYQMVAAPIHASTETYWTDERCASSMVTRVGLTCAPPASAYSVFAYDRYARVAERVMPEVLYSGTPGNCTQFPNDGRYDYYRVIDEQLPLADMVTAPDADRSRRIQVVSASTGTRRARASLLLDTQFGDCAFYKFPDGVYRCAPRSNFVGYDDKLFTDAACQSSIGLAWRFPSPDELEPSTLLLDDYSSPGDVALYDISEPYDAPAYRLQGQQCVQAELGEFRRVGRRVDWSELAAAEVVTD